MTEYVCPQRIAALFTDEYRSATEGRAAVLDWVATLSLHPGDTIIYPMSPGKWERAKKAFYTKTEVN